MGSTVSRKADRCRDVGACLTSLSHVRGTCSKAIGRGRYSDSDRRHPCFPMPIKGDDPAPCINHLTPDGENNRARE